MAVIGIVLDTRELDKIARLIGHNRDEIIEAVAFEIEGHAKQLCPVDTGALRASIHTKTKSGRNTFSSAIKAAGRISQRKGKVKKTGTKYATVGARMVEELPEPAGNVQAIVGTGMEYAAYVEFGTVRMPSRPYIGPAFAWGAKMINSGETWRRLVERR